MMQRSSQRGNIFFALFGAVALLGILGASVATFIKGPLNSSVKLTRVNVAESQMATMAQVLVMQSASVANCDADSYVEPLPYVAAGAPPNDGLTGGGLLPSNLNVATRKDPWGTEYGYCAWDHGASQCGTGGRLNGATAQVLGQTVVALVSAGPDKRFTTTCRTFAAADANTDGDLADATDLPLISKAATADDDIIFAYSYEEASGASGGLWSLKSTDPNVATIEKELEVGGDAIIKGAGSFSGLSSNTVSARTNDFVEFFNGIKVPEASAIDPTCDAGAEGVVRRNASSSLEMCVSNSWVELSGGSGGSGSGIVTDTTTVCDNTTAGAVRYNSVISQPQYCDGTAWQNFLTQSSEAIITVTPDINVNVNVTGPCTGSCPWQNGTPVNFTVTNIGTAATPAAVTSNITGGTYGSFNISWAGSTCGGAPLQPGESCVYSVYAAAAGNYTYTGILELYYGGSTLIATIPLGGTASGFGCTVGLPAGGGVAASCANATTPGYVINYPGCNVPGVGIKVYEGACNSDPADDPTFQNDDEFWVPAAANTTSGAQNIVNLAAYGNGRLPQASAYCDNLVLNGYSDWFLPSLSELQTYVYPNRAALFVSGTYWSSTYNDSSWAGARYHYMDITNNTTAYDHGYNTFKVRCMRRHGVAFPSVTTDNSPVLYFESNDYNQGMTSAGSLGDRFATVSGQRQRSEDIKLAGVNVGVAASISGSGNPAFTVNGGSPVTSTTLYNNDVINIFADAPTSAGTTYAVTLTINGNAYPWNLYYTGSNTRKIFVTNAVWNGNLGGISGADTRCQTAATAAGLTGTWYAFLGTSASPTKTRIPWNWDLLENMQGEAVATNMGDMFDKTLLSPIRYNESGVPILHRYVWTGLFEGNAELEQGNNSWNACNTWSSVSSAQTGSNGISDQVGTYWGDNGASACNLTRSLYCIGPF